MAKMTFDNKISIDGVAVIVAALSLTAWLVTIKATQVQQGETLIEHTQELKDFHQILIQEQLKNEVMDALQKISTDHEARLRSLEKDANFLRISGGGKP